MKNEVRVLLELIHHEPRELDFCESESLRNVIQSWVNENPDAYYGDCPHKFPVGISEWVVDAYTTDGIEYACYQTWENTVQGAADAHAFYEATKRMTPDEIHAANDWRVYRYEYGSKAYEQNNGESFLHDDSERQQYGY